MLVQPSCDCSVTDSLTCSQLMLGESRILSPAERPCWSTVLTDRRPLTPSRSLRNDRSTTRPRPAAQPRRPTRATPPTPAPPGAARPTASAPQTSPDASTGRPEPRLYAPLRVPQTDTSILARTPSSLFVAAALHACTAASAVTSPHGQSGVCGYRSGHWQRHD